MSSFGEYRSGNEGDRSQGRGGRRPGKGPPHPTQHPGYGPPSAGGMSGPSYDGRSQGDGTGHGWGAGPNIRERSSTGRKTRGPSVPAPANVAPAAGHNFQTLGSMPARSSGPGAGMQTLGKPKGRPAPRAVPVTAVAATTAAANAEGVPRAEEPAAAASSAVTGTQAPDSSGSASAAAAAPMATPPDTTRLSTPAEPNAHGQPAASQSADAASAAADAGSTIGPSAASSAAAQPPAASARSEAASAAGQQSASASDRSSGASSLRPPQASQSEREERSGGSQRSPHWQHQQPGPQRGPLLSAHHSQAQQPRTQISHQGAASVPQPQYSTPLYYGSMPVNAPPYVPVAARPLYVSYAAASGATLQPDAPPFVSSSAAPNSLPYQPYQMKPPPRPPSTAAASALVTPPATSVTFGSQPSSFASGHAGRMSSEPSGASLGDAPGHQQSAAIAPSSQGSSVHCAEQPASVGASTAEELKHAGQPSTPAVPADARELATAAGSAARAASKAPAASTPAPESEPALSHGQESHADAPGDNQSAPAAAESSAPAAAMSAEEPSAAGQMQAAEGVPAKASAAAPEAHQASVAPGPATAIVAGAASADSQSAAQQAPAEAPKQKLSSAAAHHPADHSSAAPSQQRPSSAQQQQQQQQQQQRGQQHSQGPKPVSFLPANASWATRRVPIQQQHQSTQPVASAPPRAQQPLPAPIAQAPTVNQQAVKEIVSMPAKQPDSSTAIPKGEPAVEQKDAQSKQQSEPASCPEPVSAAESAPQSASDAVASQDPAMEQPAPAASVSRAEAKSESSHDENSKAGPATSSEGSSSNALQPEAQASVGSAAAAAAAVVPAGAPVPAAEPPKPKTWASMAKALTNEGSGATATFKPPPVKAPAARPPSAMPAAGDRSRQVQGRGRMDAERDRSVGGRSGPPRDGQRGRGRGGQGARPDDGSQRRPGGDRRESGNRDRRGHRDQQRSASVAAAPSGPRLGGSVVSPRAVPARTGPVTATAAEQQLQQQQKAEKKSEAAASAEPAAAESQIAAPADDVVNSEEGAVTAGAATADSVETAEPKGNATTAAELETPQGDSKKAAGAPANPATGTQEEPSAQTPHPADEEPAGKEPPQQEPEKASEPKEATTPEQASFAPKSAAPEQTALAAPPAGRKPLTEPVMAAVSRLCGAVDNHLGAAAMHHFAPRGLVNTGNLCFMNSILQALMGGKDFCALLQQLREAAPALQPQEVPTLHAFSALAAEFHPVGASEASGALPNGIADKTGPKEPQYKAKEAPKSAWTKPDSLGATGLTLAARLNQQALLPDMMFPTVNRFNPNNGHPLPVTNGKAATAAAAAAAATRQQEDAQEFLNFLLDSAHQELLRLRSLHNSNAADKPAVSATQHNGADDSEEWLTAGRSKKKKAVTRGTTSIQGGVTAASVLFGGALRSEVKAQGAPASATLEPCFVVHLDIQSDAVHSVADAMAAFTSPEIISGYKVKDNSEGVTARKVVRFYQLPRILVLHLKRFSYGLKGTGKIHKPIHYGDHLRINPSWVAGGGPEPRHRSGADYDLIAVVQHHGRTPASGHYTADVRQPDGKWLRFDDSDLSGVPLSHVVDDNKAYLLFYQLRH